nr:Pol polyprotein [Tanacetum cinerariifolium]
MTNETNVTAPVNVTGVLVTNTVANHAEKPKKFNGQNFKRRQQKMFLYLTTLNLARFLKKTAPQYVLNGLVDDLYNVYWRPRLPKNYRSRWSASTKLRTLVQDLQILIHEIHAEGMIVSETFQVAIIEKLPPSWVDFKNYLKHKRKKMSVEDLIVHLRIEEDNKLAQKNTYAPNSVKANMVEHAGSSSKSNSKAKGKGKNMTRRAKGKLSHRAANCKLPKRVNPRQANMVNDNMDMIAMVSDVIAMISEVNLVGSNNSGWWVGTGATRHVCADKSMFYSFRSVDNGEKLYMGNFATADIKGEGDGILKMTFEKELKLTNVLYVLEVRKNLVSGWLLNKFGFRLVFESDKFILSNNQMYVGRGNVVNGMFKLNVMVVKNDINKVNSSAYLIESSNVWHGRLGHVNFDSTHEAIDKFVLYKTKVKNQLGRKIKVVRSDRGGEYVSPFVELCAKHGIRHEFTAPYSPQQNGIAERKNRTLEDDIQKNAVMESRNASFFENIFPCLMKETESSSRLDDEVFQDKRQRDNNDLHDERQDQLEEEEVELRRSKRARTEKSFGPDFVSFMVENEPTSYREAITSSEGHQ